MKKSKKEFLTKVLLGNDKDIERMKKGVIIDFENLPLEQKLTHPVFGPTICKSLSEGHYEIVGDKLVQTEKGKKFILDKLCKTYTSKEVRELFMKNKSI